MTDNAKPNWSSYWQAVLARHRALIAAGCISPVGARRVGVTREEREEEEHDDAVQRDNT